MPRAKADPSESASPPPGRRRGAGSVRVDANSGKTDKIAGDNIHQQINTGGGAAFLRAATVTEGDLIGRDQINTYNYHGPRPIQWPKESETEYLRRVRTEFKQKLLSRIDEAPKTPVSPTTNLFVDPILSARHTTDQLENYTHVKVEMHTGTWNELVQLNPFLGLLIGEANDGKSLLLMKIANDLAQRSTTNKSKDLPIYLTVNRYPFPNADGLLDMAAFASGQSKETLRDFWQNKTRKITFLIDNADQIPPGEREHFVRAVTQLRDGLGKSHSLLISCMPNVNKESLKDQLAQALKSDGRYREWVILPLTKDRIATLLERYGAAAWLRTLIFDNKALEVLVSHPGTLAALVKATRGLSPITPPQNLAQLYGLFIDNLPFVDNPGQPKYDYRRVKQPLLMLLAFRMIATQQNSLTISDTLCKDIARQLEVHARDFSRSRRVIPDDWCAIDILLELFDTPVINREAARDERIEFVTPIYRDYYAALYLQQIGAQWREAGDVIKQSNLDGWLDTLILLSGMPPNESSNELLNYVLSSKPDLAADLWLEKGTVGVNRIPDCVTRDYYYRRPFVPAPNELEQHPSTRYLRGIVREASPPIALQVVNGLMQLGVGGIDALLDAVESTSPIVAASAIHALFHMGGFIASGAAKMQPLFITHTKGFSFSNQGTCNATIGELVLVDVPRTFCAELAATFHDIDIDPFAAPSRFELWHTPVAWFALDYFKQKKAVDWIGLAGACSTVVRCGALIIDKALRKNAPAPIVEEMAQCVASYNLLGFFIAHDLGLPWESETRPGSPQPLLDTVFQIYKELRLLFNRTNRSRMLATTEADRSGLMVAQTVDHLAGVVIGVEADEIRAAIGDEADLPNLTRIDYAQTIHSIEGGHIQGIKVKKVMPGKFLAAEVVSLSGSMTVHTCNKGVVKGIVIDEVGRWDGIRAELALTVHSFRSSALVGISATPPKDAIISTEV